MGEAARILSMVHRAFVGREDVSARMLLAILARGHILLEDIPGVGKTTLAVAFSKALALEYSRVQFNPDVLPSDVTGFSVFHKDSGRMEYQPGAVLCNLFLADELNRATSRTQSALLEAMEEGQVTVDGVTHPIPRPFVVIATQNPTGAAGTQLLPDSQMDRFLVRLSLGYPAAEDELEMLRRKQPSASAAAVEQVVTRAELLHMQETTDAVHVHPELMRYIIRLVNATRTHPQLLQGGSPRASLALTSMAKALAYLNGRDYVVPKDISPLFYDVMAHRLLLHPRAEQEGVDLRQLLDELLRSVPAPRIG